MKNQSAGATTGGGDTLLGKHFTSAPGGQVCLTECAGEVLSNEDSPVNFELLTVAKTRHK